MRGVPAGHQGHGEVPGHHAVHREDERRGQGREEPVGAAVVLPLVSRAPPSPGRACRRSGGASPWSGRAGRRCRAPGPMMKKTVLMRQIGRDGEHVPHQGRLEVGPQVALVRVGQEEVRDPHAPGVDEGEQCPRSARRRWSWPRRRDRSEVRQGARNRIEDRARSACPAWPMPIQNTKVVMYIAHIWGVRLPAAPMPEPDLVGPGQDAPGEDEPHHAHPREVEVARAAGASRSTSRLTSA